MEHVDYPHWPGTLYECGACESECHCEGISAFTMCVFCDSNSEREEC